MLYAEGQPNLEFLGDRLDALNPARSLLRRKLLRIALDVTHESHNTGFCGNSDVTRIYTRLPLKFVEHS
jgi:hypothetical protein